MESRSRFEPATTRGWRRRRLPRSRLNLLDKVAGGMVILCHGLQRRIFGKAALGLSEPLPQPAASMEAAAGGNVRGRWGLAGQDQLALRLFDGGRRYD